MAGKAKLTGDFSKLDELVRRIEAGKATVSIGVHKEDASRVDPASGLTNAQLALIHEYGTETVPARSFVRAPLRENREKYKALGASQMRKYVKGEIRTLQAAIMPLGVAMLSDMQARLIRGISPPLQEATVQSKKHKGYPRPHVALYGTGSLYASIKVRYEGTVRKGGGGSKKSAKGGDSTLTYGGSSPSGYGGSSPAGYGTGKGY